MIEISLSFLAWLCVLFIQAIVHVKVVYLRKAREDEEPRLIERDTSTSSEKWTSEPETTEETFRRSILSRSNSNPALDDCDFDFEDDYEDDDEPPNLKHRLSQTGDEMMKSCKSLESIVQEHLEILAQ